MKHIVFRKFCIVMLAGCCSVLHVTGQLTTGNADGKIATSYVNAYGNRDTIFVFNHPKTGNLSLQQPETSTFKWYKFNDDTKKFEPFGTDDIHVETVSRDNLAQGGYKVTVTRRDDIAPRDSFVAWLYMNPGFEFTLYKDLNGEVLTSPTYKNCLYTNFILSPNTVQSSFTYSDPGNPLQAVTLVNTITYMMRTGSSSEIRMQLNTQGNTQYLRIYNPPYEDTRYYFRAYDLFGVEKSDEIMYRTIVPHVKINQPVLPKTDPASAPVPVKFTFESVNKDIITEYVWRFGNGDSIVYDLERLPPDTIRYTYYTPKQQGYEVALKVTSLYHCTYTAPDPVSAPVRITVDPPSLEVANVFTPNNDGMNDYFKPNAVSLRQFEISIFSRNGKRVYYHRGDDLRNWQGWDGRIENSGKEASEGVYFYTIRAAGWDEPPTRNPRAGPYSGSFHLYR